jgi:hypothetical protein
MADHVAKDSTLTGVPRFTSTQFNPNIITQIADPTLKENADPKKKKSDNSPPGTPTRVKKTKLKPTDNVNKGKQGIFHAKEGIALNELFPADLEKTPCAFFCFQGKKCTKPKSSCGRLHAMSFNQIEPNDKTKILKHFDKTGNAWLDAETFQRHKIDIPPDYFNLLGDMSGPTGKKCVKQLQCILLHMIQIEQISCLLKNIDN